MRSFLAALRTLVLPYGRTSGPRIVLDGINGVISVYNAISEFIRLSSEGLRVQGTASEIDMVVDSSGTDSLIIFTDPTKPNKLDWAGHSFIRATPGGLGALAVDLWSGFDVDNSTSEHSRVLVSDDQLFLTHSDTNGSISSGSNITLWRDKITIQTTIQVDGETWHNVALLASWANRAGLDPLQYRKYPDGTVHLRGTISGGTATNGTKIGSVGAGYTPPTHETVVNISTDNGPAAYSSANGSPRLLVLTNGELYIYGTGAGPLWFDARWTSVA